MNLKFPTAICFLIVLIGFLSLGYGDPSISQAMAIASDISPEAIDIDRLKQNDVIYLGENHNSPEHHVRQLEIIKQLHRSNDEPNLAIALEMFQRPFQPVLDRYLAKEIGETQLRQQSEYDPRWGWDWEFYAPILRYARQHQIPLIALNTPEEITQKVAETGIDSLEGSDFRYIPPLNEIKLDNQTYKQSISDIYLQHVEAGQGNSQDLDNFFAAQVLWDETMAEAIARHYQNNPQSQIVVLVGQAHVMNDYAIPQRVERRIRDKSFRDIVYLL